jgi:hypothetical protein
MPFCLYLALPAFTCLYLDTTSAGKRPTFMQGAIPISGQKYFCLDLVGFGWIRLDFYEFIGLLADFPQWPYAGLSRGPTRASVPATLPCRGSATCHSSRLLPLSALCQRTDNKHICLTGFIKISIYLTYNHLPVSSNPRIRPYPAPAMPPRLGGTDEPVREFPISKCPLATRAPLGTSKSANARLHQWMNASAQPASKHA